MAATADGVIVALDSVSPAARAAGLGTDDFLGRQMWEFSPDNQAVAMDALARCVFKGERVVAEMGSRVGAAEHWRVSYVKCQMPANVLVVSEKIEQGPAMTDNQVFLLQLLVNGATSGDMCKALRTTPHGLRQTLYKLRKAFGARTLAQLAVKAYQSGIR